MLITAFDTPSSSPVRDHDGPSLALDACDGELFANMRIYVSDLMSDEIAAFYTGKLRLGLVKVRTKIGVMPVLVCRIGNMIFDASYTLGHEGLAEPRPIADALLNARSLTADATWPLQVELIERRTHRTKGLRIVTPSRRFWLRFADSLLKSNAIGSQEQARMMHCLHAKYPTNLALFQATSLVESFG